MTAADYATATTHEPAGQSKGLRDMLPILATVFISFLTIGIAMPILPLHVHQGLGFGTIIVGVVAGSQFITAVVSRPWAGTFADTRGPKTAVVAGLLVSSLSGVLYLLSLQLSAQPIVAVATLVLGRGLLGAGESFVITGAQAWGLVLGGSRKTGSVIAWMGTAIFAAYAFGAPIGTMLYGAMGFSATAWMTLLMPAASLAIVALLPAVAPAAGKRAGILTVAKAVWLPATGLALSSIGFGTIVAFISLLFASRGWTVWPAFTTFAVAFMAARIFFGHLPDKFGGAKVALFCILIEAVGLVALWLAPNSGIALTGDALTGLGYSLIYPALGVEAVTRAPPESRGLAMGAYTAFLDLSLGIASPALGLIGSMAGLGAIFLASAFVVASSAFIAWRLLVAPPIIEGRVRCVGDEGSNP